MTLLAKVTAEEAFNPEVVDFLGVDAQSFLDIEVATKDRLMGDEDWEERVVAADGTGAGRSFVPDEDNSDKREGGEGEFTDDVDVAWSLPSSDFEHAEFRCCDRNFESKSSLSICERLDRRRTGIKDFLPV